MQNTSEICKKSKHAGRLEMINYVLNYECNCTFPVGLKQHLIEFKIESEKIVNEINRIKISNQNSSPRSSGG